MCLSVISICDPFYLQRTNLLAFYKRNSQKSRGERLFFPTFPAAFPKRLPKRLRVPPEFENSVPGPNAVDEKRVLQPFWDYRAGIHCGSHLSLSKRCVC
ncbi:hypothetical protein CDAR_524341 [Caerostris darwini]|uniref:Uncharacterized protein n=1 Tax=Caerostris darwini TaxID=1538125 RepID=A0AAV4TMQ9_9ARAC|nr:hypothetical protein CDAR_524341 [Caerostris darwini]